MKRNVFIKEWEHIVGFNLIDIVSFKELDEMPEIADRFYSTLLSIFKMLSRLKHNKFYNQKEMDTIFMLVKDDLYNINDLLIHVNEPGLPALIYEVVFNIFEELFVFCEDYELYETCHNLLTFRDIWFNNFGVKIVRVNAKK